MAQFELTGKNYDYVDDEGNLFKVSVTNGGEVTVLLTIHNKYSHVPNKVRNAIRKELKKIDNTIQYEDV